MKILVCISRTPDSAAPVSFTDGGKTYDENGVTFILNPYDEWYGLVRALELKEAAGGTVTVIHVGPAANEPVIRKALAIGADDAVRIDGDARDALYVATQIAAFASDKGYDLIFAGKETIDFNGATMGAMLAEMMNLPFCSFVQKLDMEGERVVVTREIEGGATVSDWPLPVVISAAKGLAEQRIPNMRGIMMAKRKPLQVVPTVDSEQWVNTVSFRLPEQRKEVQMIDSENMDELVRLLHEEAKVI